MDFFDDPNLFVGGLEGLDEDAFPSGPSLVDELNLSADFEPLHVEPLDAVKHQDGMSPVSTSTQESMPAYSQQMGHCIAIKAQSPMGQGFAGPGGGDGGMIAEQQGQYHRASVSQMPHSNGMFCNSSGAMWGNQDQNGNMYHTLSQQQQQQQLCHQQQQLHNHQLHVRQQQTQQQQHHPCHQQQQQHRIQQQLLNQRQHQQINNQILPLQQQQHHNFSFHQGSRSQSQQQFRHSQHQLTVGGQRFHSRDLATKSYLESHNASVGGTCLQQQQQQLNSYQLTRGGQDFSGSGPEDPNLPFPLQSSSIAHSLPTCIGNSATAYQPPQYPAYPGETEILSLSEQSLSSALVSRSTTTTAPITSAVPELSGTVCNYPSTAVVGQEHARTPVSQTEDCPFRALRCSGESQGSCNSSEMFGEAMSCYPIMVSQMPSEQPQSCGVINTNGYQALEGSLLPSEAQAGDLDDLEAPDLLPDLLPQLEASLSQQDGSNHSWANASQERENKQRKSPPVEFKEEKVKHSLLNSSFSFLFDLLSIEVVEMI